MPVNVIGLNSFFKSFLKESVKKNKPKKKFVWLIGAGMSASSGIPLAQGVSDRITLLEYLDASGLPKPWFDLETGENDFDTNDFLEEIGAHSEGLYNVDSLIKYFKWYEDVSEQEDTKNLIDSAYEWLKQNDGFESVSRRNPECYQLLFDRFILSKETATDFLSALIRMSTSVNLAHLSLAGILRDFPEWGDTVYTTNFDDLLLKALLQLNKSARVFGEYESTVKPSTNPNYPQIIHLHGKHTGYGIKNTKEEISYIKPVLQESFRTHISDSNLIIVGYSGWDDLVMKTLKEWTSNSELIRGSIYWVPYLGPHTMVKEVLEYLETLPYSNQINIIVRDDLITKPNKNEGLDADYFMVKMCNFINRGENGFLPYRQEIVSNAERQHKFILKDLKNYPEFSPERVFTHITNAESNYYGGYKNNFNKEIKKALKIISAKDLPNLIKAKAYLSLGNLFYKIDDFETSIKYCNLAESYPAISTRSVATATRSKNLVKMTNSL